LLTSTWLMDRAAGAAAVLGAADAQDAQLRRDPVEHLARRLADPMEATAAVRAFMALHVEPHLLPRQMSGERRAPGRGSGPRVLIARRRWNQVGFGAGSVGIEVFQAESQLVRIELLGAASELPSLKLLDEAPETLDLGVTALDDA
jgi:hypothetical protein